MFIYRSLISLQVNILIPEGQERAGECSIRSAALTWAPAMRTSTCRVCEHRKNFLQRSACPSLLEKGGERNKQMFAEGFILFFPSANTLFLRHLSPISRVVKGYRKILTDYKQGYYCFLLKVIPKELLHLRKLSLERFLVNISAGF